MNLEINIPFKRTEKTKLRIVASFLHRGLSISTKHEARVDARGLTHFGTTFIAFNISKPEKPQPWIIEYVRDLAWHYKLQVFLMRFGVRMHNIISGECMPDFSCCSWQSHDDKAMMGILGALTNSIAQSRGHVSDSCSNCTNGIHVANAVVDTCKICGKHSELRLGVCFQCKDFCLIDNCDEDVDGTSMYRLHEINNPNNWWISWM